MSARGWFCAELLMGGVGARTAGGVTRVLRLASRAAALAWLVRLLCGNRECDLLPRGTPPDLGMGRNSALGCLQALSALC